MDKDVAQGFPGGAVVGSPPADAGDTGHAPLQEDTTCCGVAEPIIHGC